MPTQTLPTRRKVPVQENVGSSFAYALLAHLLIAGSIIGYTLLPGQKADTWGEHASQAGSVQATMVDALPLPPHQRQLDKAVLTSDNPNVAPSPTTAKTEPPPKPNEVLIPDKSQTKAKPGEKPAPEPPKHPQPVAPTTKATTGETGGIQIAQSTLQTNNGTASISVAEKSFGERYAYYVNAVTRKITENWFAQEADPRTSAGRTVSINFTIDRDGAIANIAIAQKSGSPSLDTSSLRALQRIDTFGPLPGGSDHVSVQYTFVYRQP